MSLFHYSVSSFHCFIGLNVAHPNTLRGEESIYSLEKPSDWLAGFKKEYDWLVGFQTIQSIQLTDE